jgi:GTPase SAR1 family protein
VLLGQMGVGKTSIIERFVKDEFEAGNNVHLIIYVADDWD